MRQKICVYSVFFEVYNIGWFSNFSGGFHDGMNNGFCRKIILEKYTAKGLFPYSCCCIFFDMEKMRDSYFVSCLFSIVLCWKKMA